MAGFLLVPAARLHGFFSAVLEWGAFAASNPVPDEKQPVRLLLNLKPGMVGLNLEGQLTRILSGETLHTKDESI